MNCNAFVKTWQSIVVAFYVYSRSSPLATPVHFAPLLMVSCKLLSVFFLLSWLWEGEADDSNDFLSDIDNHQFSKKTLGRRTWIKCSEPPATTELEVDGN